MLSTLQEATQELMKVNAVAVNAVVMKVNAKAACGQKRGAKRLYLSPEAIPQGDNRGTLS